MMYDSIHYVGSCIRLHNNTYTICISCSNLIYHPCTSVCLNINAHRKRKGIKQLTVNYIFSLVSFEKHYIKNETYLVAITIR